MTTMLFHPHSSPPFVSPRRPRIQCLFGECGRVHQAGQNRPNLGYFNSRHFYEQVHIRKLLENAQRIKATRRRRESNVERPKPTQSGPDPGAPPHIVTMPERKALPPITLDVAHPLVRRPLTVFDETPQVDEVDMEEWCSKPFSAIEQIEHGYLHQFPLLMTKYSETEEKEIEIKEFHTKRNSVVVSDFSHGIIALTEPGDEEFKEFIDLFQEKHQLPEIENMQTDIGDLSHLEQLMAENLKAKSSQSKESVQSSENSVMSDTSCERSFQNYHNSHKAERRMTLSEMKKPLTTSSLQGTNGPVVWGRKSLTSGSTTQLPGLRTGWTGGRRSSLVEGPMSLLNTERKDLYSNRRHSLISPKRTSFAGPLARNSVNLLSVLEEAGHSYPILEESSITDLTVRQIPKEEDEINRRMDRSEKNIHRLEQFLENMSDSDSDSDD
ncbi:uncharacterized protein LOC144363591 [Saccoglossus kowalevskii]